MVLLTFPSHHFNNLWRICYQIQYIDDKKIAKTLWNYSKTCAFAAWVSIVIVYTVHDLAFGLSWSNKTTLNHSFHCNKVQLFKTSEHHHVRRTKVIQCVMSASVSARLEITTELKGFVPMNSSQCYMNCQWSVFWLSWGISIKLYKVLVYMLVSHRTWYVNHVKSVCYDFTLFHHIAHLKTAIMVRAHKIADI
jgi:hypothetical protein